MLSDQVRRELADLDREIGATDLSKHPRELQWAQLRIWAGRYRLLLEQAGTEHAETPEFRGVYRAIRTRMAGVYPAGKGPYIAALGRDESRDWTKELEDAKRDYQEILDRHARYTKTRGLLAEIESFLAGGDPRNEEEEQRLHHLVRDAARHENLRGELSDMLEPYRKILPSEFDFLWEKPATSEEPQARKRLSNHDILCRILRRLVQNGIIGERYCPLDMVTRGFEGADRGRAKEAVDLLVRDGVLLAFKDGTTVSVSPKWVSQAKRFFRAGEPLGLRDVDDWASG
jgi:hypothetical protein